MTCFYCKGDMEEATTTYAADNGKSLIVIRRVPCHKCKQCGKENFPFEVTKRLEQITEQFEKMSTEVAIVNYSAL